MCIRDSSRPVQFLRTGNAPIARKPHAAAPFRTNGLAGQSGSNKLSIGHPDWRTLLRRSQWQAPLFTGPCISVFNRIALSQRAHDRPLWKDSLNMRYEIQNADASFWKNYKRLRWLAFPIRNTACETWIKPKRTSISRQLAVARILFWAILGRVWHVGFAGLGDVKRSLKIDPVNRF